MGKFKIGVQLTERDLGWSRIRAEFDNLAKKPYVKVGVQGTQAKAAKKFRNSAGQIIESGHIDLVQVATIHEFGAPGANIPERSFIRSTMEENKQAFWAYAQELQQRILMGEIKTEDALGMLGEKIQAAIQAKFTNNDWPPLAAATLGQRTGHVGNQALKGVHRPLVDTGQLRQSIRYKKVMSGRDSDD